jgi:hypothetical protein
MGCSISCATFEKFSTFLHWAVSDTRNQHRQIGPLS